MNQGEMECGIPLRISQEFLRTIFKRLPVRTLIQLQCVCKDWKNLLNDPSFIQEHLLYSAHENPSLLIHCLTVLNTLELYTIDCEMQILPVESVPLIESLPNATVIGSINGLVCVKSNDKFLNILVWNPAIREFRLLTREAHLWVEIGFGFCSIVNDYKVVSISKHDHGISGLIYQVEVYALSTCSWKKVEVGGLLDGLEIRSDGCCTDGAIFWFGFKKGNGHMLVSYCIETEEFAFISSPISAPVWIDSFFYSLSVYENKLALLSHTTIGNYEDSLIDLWVMEEGKDSTSEERWSWTKKYSIKHPYWLLPWFVRRNMIVCMYHAASEHEVVDDGLNIVLVNLTTNELKKFASHKYGIAFYGFSYVESLVPVD
ncbi:hypothetical protein K1719_002269 [Acacia pycnantha]|nr:hypothetical protein K1719_002269 [Acacia pycnantha]